MYLCLHFIMTWLVWELARLFTMHSLCLILLACCSFTAISGKVGAIIHLVHWLQCLSHFLKILKARIYQGKRVEIGSQVLNHHLQFLNISAQRQQTLPFCGGTVLVKHASVVIRYTSILNINDIADPLQSGMDWQQPTALPQRVTTKYTMMSWPMLAFCMDADPRIISQQENTGTERCFGTSRFIQSMSQSLW